MTGIQAKRKRLKRILHSKVLRAILLLVAVLLGNAVWNMYGTYREARARALTAQEEAAELEERASVLEARVARLETDRGKEEEIRRKFLVAKEGEGVIVLVGDRNDAASAGTSNAGDGGWSRVWSGIVDFFR